MNVTKQSGTGLGFVLAACGVVAFASACSSSSGAETNVPDTGTHETVDSGGHADSGGRKDSGGHTDSGDHTDAGGTKDSGTHVDGGTQPDSGSHVDGSQTDSGHTDSGSQPDGSGTADSGTDSGTDAGGGSQCSGATPGALTVKNYDAWCSVTVAGGAESASSNQTVCVADGAVTLVASADPGFILGDWHGTAGDTGSGEPGTVSGGMSTASVTVSGSTAACVWVCCPFTDGSGCPTANQCP